MLSKMLRGSVNNTTNPTNSDANFKQVSLLLHGDGTNGAQNNTFLDSSTNNFTVTRNGNTTQGTNTPFSQTDGYWSNYFDATTASALTYSGSVVNTDFTMECWVYKTATNGAGYGNVFCNSAGSVQQNVQNDGSVYFYIGSAAPCSTATGKVPLNTWTHIAWVRSGTTCTIYVNGVSSATGTSSASVTVTSIGQNTTTNFVGYMSNVRITNTAVYTSAFTPPTTPLTAISGTSLLTCQSNNFKDNSSNNFAITATGTPSVQPFSPFAPTSAYSTSVNGGSMYFDGTGDCLSATSSTFSSTGDFTMECWGYVTSVPSYAGFITMRSSITGSGGAINILNTGYFDFGIYAAGSYTSTLVPLNQWFHVALVRSGSGTNNCSCYLNGIRVGQFTAVGTDVNATSNVLDIGRYYSGYNNYYLNGYVSNARYVVGTAVYSGTTYTVPTAPLTAITNTQLLLNGTNAGIYDNAIKNDLETVGNAQVSTSVVKYGTGSMSFNGTTDYLTTPTSPQFAFGTGAWTIEGWFYFNSVASGQQPVSGYTTVANENYAWYMTSTGGLAYYLSSTGNSWNIASNVTMGTVSANTWTHIALVRNGSTFTPYINGVAGTTSSSSSAIYSSGTGITLGAYAGAYFFNGYIDDFRVTKGIARYTANFTAPTSAFPNS